ncbi:hypothetical protein NDU88_002609 [Pleurodeles waltl]|uniref:Myb/SANT-like DNA-binding domain-containing protein n=1 Tax=Pleurodeles waltl TaxID=8319 RepID=A0AAV7LKN9_PLEWA|nr:hypothetical protein NDU88_002609 [Pleurodeles waltl]
MELWRRILDRVNAVGQHPRTRDDIRKRWNDLRGKGGKNPAKHLSHRVHSGGKGARAHVLRVKEPAQGSLKGKEPAQAASKKGEEPAQAAAKKGKEPAQAVAKKRKEPAQAAAKKGKEPAQVATKKGKEPAQVATKKGKEPAPAGTKSKGPGAGTVMESPPPTMVE